MANRAIRILAIDDIPDNLISLSALIKETFPETLISTALSGEKGLELAAAEDPDVILLDIVMPGMDGFEVCRNLKNDKKLRDVPVVFVTALKGDKACRIRALEAGAEGFLAKPIDEIELTAQIRAMVKIKSANIEKRDEKVRLIELVEEQTSELRKAHKATLKLLEDLQNENAARKKSEETLLERDAALASSQIELKAIYDNAPVMMCLVDADRRVLYANPALTAFITVGKEDLHGGLAGNVLGCINALDDPRGCGFGPQCQDCAIRLTMEDTLKTGIGHHNVECHSILVSDRDRREVTFLGSTALIQTVGQKHLLLCLNDITDRKRAEKEKETLQTQLLQAQKMEAIGTLAGGITHDFNNILGAIIGYSEIASDCIPPKSEAIEHLGKVLKASERATTLVKQILAFSRQENIERIPLKPNYIVKEAIKLLRPSLPSTININQKIEVTTRSILADPTQVHQILMNLCTNAFHAMEKTGGTIEITLEDRTLFQEDLQHKPDLLPGAFVLLSVGDTGPGILPEILNKIFDPYFTTKEAGKGTGMGLAIIHGIVTNYGGFVTCESEIGKGTVFEIYFPAIEQRVASEVKSVEVTPPGTEHILLVDDEVMLADLGKTMLERLGYAVTMRTSSLDALAIFHNQPAQFDVVITDQTMPDMTGVDLARQMLGIRPDLPIILCTGHSNLITEEQAKNYGVKGFVMKPFTKKEIAALLRKVLDDKVQA